jgi:hypothetical protein
MDAGVFSREVVSACLRKNPPARMVLGGQAGFVMFITDWLPRSFLDYFMYTDKRLGLQKLENASKPANAV